MNTEREGGCLCGAVRFKVRGEPVRTGVCHCLDCRRVTGSAFNYFAVWPLSVYEATGELSTFAGRSFCSVCGSRVVSLGDFEAEIYLGTLDDPLGDIVPGYELWTPRREQWLLQLPWADQFKADRDAVGKWRQPIIQF